MCSFHGFATVEAVPSGVPGVAPWFLPSAGGGYVSAGPRGDASGLAWPSVCPRLFAVLVTYGLATNCDAQLGSLNKSVYT